MTSSFSNSASFSDCDIEDSIKYAAEKLQIKDVRDHQKQALLHLLKGKDVFVNLPTGYGKSAIFHSAPLCKDYLTKKVYPLSSKSSLAVVISPVTALIEDQVKHLDAVGLKSLYLRGGSHPS